MLLFETPVALNDVSNCYPQLRNFHELDTLITETVAEAIVGLILYIMPLVTEKKCDHTL